MSAFHTPIASARLVAPGGPVSMAVRAMHDETVVNLNATRLVRLADSVTHLHDRLDVMMGATGPALRPALEAMVDSIIEALDRMDGADDREDGADDEPSLGWPDGRDSQRFNGGGYDLEHDIADAEPSLGSLGGTGASYGVCLGDLRLEGHAVAFEPWAGGGRSDREPDAGDEPEVDHDFEAVNEDGDLAWGAV